MAEVGCGTGRVTRHLQDAGLRVVGLDLSPGMLRAARAVRPGLALVAAHAGALPLRSASVEAVVAWYSLIHLPTVALGPVLAELARVLRPGAPLLLACPCGDGERVDRTTSYERQVPLTYYRHRVQDVVAAVEGAGFTVTAQVNRAAALSFESTPQAILVAAAQ